MSNSQTQCILGWEEILRASHPIHKVEDGERKGGKAVILTNVGVGVPQGHLASSKVKIPHKSTYRVLPGTCELLSRRAEHTDPVGHHLIYIMNFFYLQLILYFEGISLSVKILYMIQPQQELFSRTLPITLASPASPLLGNGTFSSF